MGSTICSKPSWRSIRRRRAAIGLERNDFCIGSFFTAKALDFLLPYVTGEKKWPYRQISEMHPEDLAGPLLEAAAAFHDDRYKDVANRLLHRSAGSQFGFDKGRMPLLFAREANTRILGAGMAGYLGVSATAFRLRYPLSLSIL